MGKTALILVAACGAVVGACGGEEKKDPACADAPGTYSITVATTSCPPSVGTSATCPSLFTMDAAGQVVAPPRAELVAAAAGNATFVDLDCTSVAGDWDEYICQGKDVAGCCKRKDVSQPQQVTWQYRVGNPNDGYVCGKGGAEAFPVKLKLHIPGQCTLAEETVTFNCP